MEHKMRPKYPHGIYVVNHLELDIVVIKIDVMGVFILSCEDGQGKGVYWKKVTLAVLKELIKLTPVPIKKVPYER